VDALRRLTTRLRRDAFLPIWVATAVLFLVSPILAPGSMTQSALLGMLPFAAILAIASIGQTLVVQQRGLDLSIPGMISLSVLLVTKIPDGQDGGLPVAIAAVLVASVLAGLLSGLAVTRFGITPLIATLGVNALLIGTVVQISGGAATDSASPALDAFAIGRTLGIPNTVVVAVVLLAVVSIVVRATVAGRRFVVVGASPPAARAAGIDVARYQVGTYVVSSLFAGIAGIILAGYLHTPGHLAGDRYLLPTIAAVVLGGTSLAGGNGSVIATAVGALFLVQLQQVVLGMGAPPSIQLIIQGLIIAMGMAARTVDWRRVRRVLTGGPSAPLPSAPVPPASASSDPPEGGGR
jgi:ribose transport system permease protein